MFLRKHSEDPAIKDFLPKLKCFLLLKIKEILIQENALSFFGDNPEAVSGGALSSIPVEGQVYIAADCLYKHNLMRLNYTMYVVHRAQDIINPSTSYCNIMLLADCAPSDVVGSVTISPFPYACGC
ncbi:hypothetical protein SCLCIDRAFT_30255 [Scleroderma citrinum Foug A]|uniref:Uncharacterized protein n=1 Tax=Scleroderma citrinum Foug A TaxID=1036808 RepID=A0A0C3D427_9AGAM|nr:hypothetical protein SCLCIDRAFT_30255 [Scleroderma citrinum Foug A]